MNNNVFIITAAHQYLYIYEAVKKFHQNDNNILYFLNFQGSDEYLALKNILLDINWSSIIEIPLYRYQSLLYRYIEYKYLVKRLQNIKINTLYISQYGPSYSYMILNSIDAHKKIITDDGRALLVFSKIRQENLNYIKYDSLKMKMKKILYKMYEPKHLVFFTTNNITVSSQDKILKNDLHYLGESFSKNKTTDKLLFLGSPFVSKKMMSQEKYEELLKSIFDLYQNNKIYYYPHRAESLSDLNKLRTTFENLEIISSMGPVEFYLISNLSPKKVISFYSGAVPNLLQLFKNNLAIDVIKIPNGFFISKESLKLANMVYAEYRTFENDKFHIIDLKNIGREE